MFVYSCFVLISVTEISCRTSAAPTSFEKPTWKAGMETIGLTLGTISRESALMVWIFFFSFSQGSPALKSTALLSAPGPSLCCFYLTTLLTPDVWDFFPTKSTSSPTLWTLTRCPTIQLNSDTNYLESAQPAQVKGSVPQDCPPRQTPISSPRSPPVHVPLQL